MRMSIFLKATDSQCVQTVYPMFTPTVGALVLLQQRNKVLHLKTRMTQFPLSAAFETHSLSRDCQKQQQESRLLFLSTVPQHPHGVWPQPVYNFISLPTRRQKATLDCTELWTGDALGRHKNKHCPRATSSLGKGQKDQLNPGVLQTTAPEKTLC